MMKEASLAVKPPAFVMWGELPEDEERDWERQWFGHELAPEAAFHVRGIGIRESYERAF